MLSHRFARLDKIGFEESGIQKISIRAAGTRTKARQVGETPDGDLVGNFEGEEEFRRDLRSQVFEVSAVRKLVIGGIHTYRLEHLGVLCQTIFVKARLGKAATPDIAAIIVELTAPARVFPGGSAEKNAMRRKIRCGSFHFVEVKGHAIPKLVR